MTWRSGEVEATIAASQEVLGVGRAKADIGIGAKIEKGEVGFKELEAYTLENGEPEIKSGRQEMLENILNEYIA